MIVPYEMKVIVDVYCIDINKLTNPLGLGYIGSPYETKVIPPRSSNNKATHLSHWIATVATEVQQIAWFLGSAVLGTRTRSY